MNIINTDRENNIFGALKLIEQLYLDGEISGHVSTMRRSTFTAFQPVGEFTNGWT